MIISKVYLVDLCLLVFYKVLLDVSYKTFVSPLFGYQGLILDVSSLKLIESYCFTVLMFLALPKDHVKISAIGIQILFLLIMVPLFSLYAMMNAPRLYVYFAIASYLITILIIKAGPTIRFRTIKPLNTIFLWFALGTISIIVYVVLIKLNGIPSLQALLFASIYEIREEFETGFGIMNYLLGWQANVINAFFISLAFYRKRYFVLVLAVIFHIILFLITANRVYFFTPFILIFVISAVRRKRLMSMSLIGLTLMIMLSLTLYELKFTDMPASLAIRRALFAPAQVSFTYYDFFSKHEKMYLSESKAGLGFAKNPYYMHDTNSALMIGGLYFNDPDNNANTGYIGDAYMNFGFLGMMIFSAILGLLLILADSISKRKSIYISIATLLIPILSLLNSALFTIFLTKGFLLGLMILWIYHETPRRS